VGVLEPSLRAHALRAGCVSWSEVQHWLWPMFDWERWGPWRQHRLGLPAVPFGERFADAVCEAALPPPPPLLYGER
jgi:hypothetical protein